MPVRQPVKTLAQHTFVYGIGSIANKFVAILLIPILTRTLSRADVGFVAIIEMIELFLTSFLVLGMGNGLLRHLNLCPPKDQKALISSVFWIRLALNVVVTIVLVACRHSWGNFLGIPPEYEYLLPWIFLNGLLVVTGRFYLTLWRFWEQPQKVILLSLIQLATHLGLAIFFLLGPAYGVASLVFSKCIVYGLSTLFTIISVLGQYSVQPRWSYFARVGSFGFAFIPLAMVAPVLTTSDRFFLNRYVDLSTIGVYSIGYKFGMLINMLLVTPMQMAWLPMLFKMNTEKKSAGMIRDLMYYYSFLAVLVLVLVTVFREEIILLLATEKYLPGARFIPVIALAYLANGYRHFFLAGSALKDRTTPLGIMALVTIGLNLILNYVFIKSMGTWGAAIATVISYVFLSLSIWYQSDSAWSIQWQWKRIGLLFAWGGFVSFLSFEIFLSNSVYRIGVEIFWVILFFLGIRVFGLINAREWAGIQSLGTQILQKVKGNR
ncbi:MAG: polysaccharide biosynthesis protein [Candidatus Neomarinimicrobiota bacterium]|nr:MAG: polysaccharide biosynthesis protein [Candidatus Neomarinimicrobiota bacterium]